MIRMRLLSPTLVLSLCLACGQTWAAPLCAAPGKDGPTYNPDTYYAGSGSASVGGTTVNLGAMRTGDGNASTAPITPGDQVFIIQMQGADINNSNSVSYGNGSSGQGYTAINSTGRYEFAVVTSVSGSTLTLRDPLINSYVSSAASSTSTRKSFQVIRVPQHSSLTLGQDITTPVWNGFTGGVTVLDVAGSLNLNGRTVEASGAGFRGGGSYADSTEFGHTDYANVWNGLSKISAGAMKGEGIAGTPSLVTRGNTVSTGVDGISANLSSGDLGYPAGYVVARGAPGNAGGGGTQHNAGGGGGGNAGAGGQGGKTFGGDGSRDVGGLGGIGVTPTADRLLAGGGGGAGDANDLTVPTAYGGTAVPDRPLSTSNISGGGNGGGIIVIRAGTLTGSGTLKADGLRGGDALDNGGGGGGAGGTVAILADISIASLNISAKGGNGGYSGHPNGSGYGTGGGGGGGAVLLSPGIVGSADVSGGKNGLLFVPNANAGAYGSVGGTGGVGSAPYSPATANVNLPAACLPQLTVTKTTSTPRQILPGATQATYTITVSNSSGRGNAVGVTVSDPALPGNLTYASTSALTLGPAGATTGYQATRSSTTDPAAGTNAPVWSSFTIPGGASVTVTFVANLNGTAPGTYQNPAQATYLNPVRTATSGTAIATYDPKASQGEDITLIGRPNVVLEKWVRNVTRNGTFGTSANGTPGEKLEYCVNFRETNGAGYDARNFVLTDASTDVLTHTNVLTDAYGPSGSGLGIRLASGVQVIAGSGQPSGTNFTSADTDSDGAKLTQAGGLEYRTDLLGGNKGVVCFQVQIK